MPGHLVTLAGQMVHPRGWIETDLHFDNGRVRGNICLPAELTGTFRYAGKSLDLQPGRQSIDL
jgi:hypothetical protein